MNLTSARSLVVQTVCDPSHWDSLRSSWDDLFDASPTASPPLRFDWLWNWWRLYGPVYGDGAASLRIFTVHRDGQFVGVLPLYRPRSTGAFLTARKLMFLSTGEAEHEETCAEYLDLLHEPGLERQCLDAIDLHLRRGQDWDGLDLLDISGQSPLMRWATHGRLEPRGECAMADISGGLELYLGRLTTKQRHNARRLLRRADEVGAEFQLAADSSQATEFFLDMAQLHPERWTAVGQPGCFAAPRFLEFHRQLATEWVPQNRAILARVRHGGQTHAAVYGFLVAGKFDFYQSGVRVDSPKLRNPGVLAFLLLMRELANRGAHTFDFLRGSYSYKQRLMTAQQPLFRLRRNRANLRGRLDTASQFLRRIARPVYAGA
jgi:CelD/BcsL family acetyltransferase involved in cellulose biosynthesis